jgi:hypothetical protein
MAKAGVGGLSERKRKTEECHDGEFDERTAG